MSGEHKQNETGNKGAGRSQTSGGMRDGILTEQQGSRKTRKYWRRMLWGVS